MAAMVLVNNAGGPDAYAPLHHAAWSGWTFTDTIFPSFLWIVGVALTLAFSRRCAAGAGRTDLLLHALRRAAILYAIGLFIYLYPHFNFSTMRVFGVLQRIAICYFVAAAVYLFTGVRGQIVCVFAVLAAYWLLMMLYPVPGYGAGRLDMAGNFEHYVDRMVLGRHNYNGRSWDPEGIVSTLPAIATALFGVLAGGILRARRTLAENAAAVLSFGVLLLSAGTVLNTWMPINKQLWTPTFAVFMAGLSTLGFGVCLWACDVRGYGGWWTRPLVIFGRNAIAVYVFSELLDPTLELTHATRSIMSALYRFLSPANACLAYASANVLACYVLAWYLHRRGWLIRF
jgi:predicted acyltransferase